MGCSTKCCSIENGGGSCVRGKVATGGWARPERTDRRQATEPHHRSLANFLGAAGGKRKELRKSELVGKTGGQVAARKKRVSTCCLFRSR